MKILKLLLCWLLTFPVCCFAFGGCPGDLLLVEGRCQNLQELQNLRDLNDYPTHFPLNYVEIKPPDIRSSAENPMIVGDNSNPYARETLTFSSVSGPWVIRSNTFITAQTFSEWPYVELPVNVAIVGELPLGGPRTAPGISCTIRRTSNSATISCYASKEWWYGYCVDSGLGNQTFCQNWAQEQVKHRAQLR